MFSLELDFTRSGETVTDLELKESLLMPYFIKPLKTRLSIAVRRLTIGPSEAAGVVKWFSCARLSASASGCPENFPSSYLRNVDSSTRYPECYYGKKSDHQLPHQICSTYCLSQSLRLIYPALTKCQTWFWSRILFMTAEGYK